MSLFSVEIKMSLTSVQHVDLGDADGVVRGLNTELDGVLWSFGESFLCLVLLLLKIGCNSCQYVQIVK